jgi:membrane protein YqaA with SNARE-associated domain
LHFAYCFMFIYAFASCSIAWFPSIVLVGFSSS